MMLFSLRPSQIAERPLRCRRRWYGYSSRSTVDASRILPIAAEAATAARQAAGDGPRVGLDREERMRVAAFGGAVQKEMVERVHPDLRDVGVLLKIPRRIEQRIGIASFSRPELEIVIIGR